MSIEGKNFYKKFLKSEKWQIVRLEALVREKAKCQICTLESISNDAHHAWYPENIYETTESQLVILCRPCHSLIHAFMPDCKTNDEQKGRLNWLHFSGEMIAWVRCKMELFHSLPEDSKYWHHAPPDLRKELRRLQIEVAKLKSAACVKLGLDNSDYMI